MLHEFFFSFLHIYLKKIKPIIFSSLLYLFDFIVRHISIHHICSTDLHLGCTVIRLYYKVKKKLNDRKTRSKAEMMTSFKW